MSLGQEHNGPASNTFVSQSDCTLSLNPNHGTGGVTQWAMGLVHNGIWAQMGLPHPEYKLVSNMRQELQEMDEKDFNPIAGRSVSVTRKCS